MNARLLLAAGLAFSAVLGACGLATKGDDGSSPGCVQECGATDAGVADTKEGGFVADAAEEGGHFSPYCATGCDPDPASAVPSCADAGTSGTESFGHAPVPGNTLLGCQVVRTSSGSGAASCVAVGMAVEGDPCATSTDCSAGMACINEVDDPTAGRCRTYCCAETSTCSEGTYCSDLPLFEPTLSGNDPLFLPVCAPATNCKLLEPGQCAAEQACVLVNDKTTSCQPASTGKDGEKCPCAADYYCVKKTLTCRKLCHVSPDSKDCPDGICESGSAFPEGFGICE